MTVKLDPEFKRRWVEALRSGEYVQIIDRLGDCSNGRCCLGVATDVAMEMGIVPNLSVSVEFGERLYVDDEGLAEDTELPGPVREALLLGEIDILLQVDLATLGDHVELSEVDESFRHPGMYSAALLNDSGMTFAEIADLIEQQL